MRRLSSLGFRTARQRAGRSALAASGLALGVALLFGILVANASVSHAFHQATGFAPARQLGNISVLRVDGHALTDSDIARIAELSDNGLSSDGFVAYLDVPPDQAVQVRERAVATLGPAYAVDVVSPRPSSASQTSFSRFLDNIEAGLAAFAAVAVFVAGFLVYLTSAASVAERTKLFGTLRAIGATRRHIRRLVVIESLAVGSVAAAIGLVLGLGIATITITLLARAVNIPDPPMLVSPASIALAAGAGMLTAAVSAMIPAVRASRLDPVEAMAGAKTAGLRQSRAWVGGVVCIPVGAALMVTSGSSGAGQAGGPLVLLGAVLLVPPLLRPLGRVTGGVLGRVDRASAAVPVPHVVKERSRSANTTALLMVVLAMTYALVATIASFHAGIGIVYDKQFGHGLVVTPRIGALSEGLVEGLRTTPGVASATPIWYGSTAIAGLQETTMVVDPATYFGSFSFAWVDGDDATARRALDAGGAILLPIDVADRAGVRRGDTVTVTTTAGPKTFTVAGTMVRIGFTEFMGPVVGRMDREAVRALPFPLAIRVALAPGADGALVTQRVAAALGPPGAVQVRTAEELRASFTEIVDRYFTLFDAVVLIAFIVGTLGVANTLGISVVDRVREIGILRSIGARRSHIRRMVITESVTLAVGAFVLSLPVGVLLAKLVVDNSRQRNGYGAVVRQPVVWFLPIAALAIVAGLVAALVPARRAARLDPVDALRHD